MKRPEPGEQALKFWIATFLIVLGLIALCGVVAFGVAWLLD